MKAINLYLIIALSFSPFCIADDTRSTVPLTAGDLKNILELHVVKNRVDFEKAGYPRLEIKQPKSKPLIVTLPYPSDSATIVTYLERGEPDMDTDILHFWFSSERFTHSSSFSFLSAKAKHTQTGIIDGIYQVVATKSKNDLAEIGYILQVTSTDKSRTNESSEPPTRSELKSK